jgi:ketol-acid reductoisomerase
MGEQTNPLRMLQTGSLLCFDKMVEKGIDKGYAAKLVQFGWETITEAMKIRWYYRDVDRLSNPAKLRVHALHGF